MQIKQKIKQHRHTNFTKAAPKLTSDIINGYFCRADHSITMFLEVEINNNKKAATKAKFCWKINNPSQYVYRSMRLSIILPCFIKLNVMAESNSVKILL